MIHNTKRAASVKCVKKGYIFGLDRKTFNSIVQDAVIKKRKEWMVALNRIEILQELSQEEKEQLLDALREENF